MAANDLVQDASLPVASSIMASDNHDPEKSAMVSGGILGATNVGNREPPMSAPVNKNKGRYSSPNGSFFYGASNSLPLSPDSRRRDRPSTNGRFQPYERKPLSRKNSQSSPKDEEMFSSSPEEANENVPYVPTFGSASPTSKLGSPNGPSARKKHSPGKENMSACVHNFPSQSSPHACRFHNSRFEVPPKIQEQQTMSGSMKQNFLCTGATIDGTPPTLPIPMQTNGSPMHSGQTSPSPDEPTIQDRPLERESSSELIGEKNDYLKRIPLLKYAGGHQRYAFKEQSIKLQLECSHKPTLQLSLCHSGVEDDYSLKLVAKVTFPTKCPQVIRESIVKLAVKIEEGQTQSAINKRSITFTLRETPEITQIISYEQLLQSKCVTFSLKTQIFLCEFHPDVTTGMLKTSDCTCHMVNITDFEDAVDIRYTGVPQP